MTRLEVALAFAAAVGLATLPTLIFWFGRRRSAWGALLLAVGAMTLLAWLTQGAIDAALQTHRVAWLDAAPIDWAALDQAGRKAAVDAVAERTAHGKLLAGMGRAALGFGGAALALAGARVAYDGWQARRQPRLDG